MDEYTARALPHTSTQIRSKVGRWLKKNSIRNDAAKAPNTDYLQAVAQNAERN